MNAAIGLALLLCFLAGCYVGLMCIARRAIESLTPEELGRLLREMGDDL